MAKTREKKYIEQLMQLGIYQPAFDPEIHTLAMMEREHQRILKTWKESGSAADSDLYPIIVQQRRDILAHRDALGLTPKALRRLKAASIVPEASAAVDAQGGSPVVSALLDTLRAQANVNAGVSESDTGHG